MLGRGTLGTTELRRAPAHGAKAPTLARWIGLGRGSCGRTAPSAAARTEGKDFAFTIIDATDNATLARIRPIYELLSELGLRTTKTVWVYPAPESKCWGDADTLEDPTYRAYILDLQTLGFEIALHGVHGGATPATSSSVAWALSGVLQPPASDSREPRQEPRQPLLGLGARVAVAAHVAPAWRAGCRQPGPRRSE